MISPRIIWRALVLPTYILMSGVVFALALRNTAGSILSPIAALAPWIMGIAAALAMLSIAGAVLRGRRRLAAVRRGRAARVRVTDTAWNDSDAGIAHHVRPG